MRPIYSFVLIVAVCFAAPALAADGKIVGKVTLDGKPLIQGKVLFHPAKGKAVTADLAADGTYSIKRISAGKYRVCVKGKGVPAKYSSPDKTVLLAEVKEGANTIDLVLK
jgi:hypothetical protein